MKPCGVKISSKGRVVIPAQQVAFEPLINIRHRQDNPSMDILAANTRDTVEQIVRKLLGDV